MNDAERSYWRGERRRRWQEVRLVLVVIGIAVVAIWVLWRSLRS